ncbi:hypothetical protein AAE478_005917 [Parahypoxylon ruwenzoriense]
MPNSQLQKWWRNQVAQAAARRAALPSVPICPCEACFNGDEPCHNTRSFHKEARTGREAKNTASISVTEKGQSGMEHVKKPSHKQLGRLLRRPSTTSIASDLAPLCSTTTTTTIATTSSTTQSTPRTSCDTLVWHPHDEDTQREKGGVAYEVKVKIDEKSC